MLAERTVSQPSAAAFSTRSQGAAFLRVANAFPRCQRDFHPVARYGGDILHRTGGGFLAAS